MGGSEYYTINANVSAIGTCVPRFAKDNFDKCINRYYTHIATLTYDFMAPEGQRTTLVKESDNAFILDGFKLDFRCDDGSLINGDTINESTAATSTYTTVSGLYAVAKVGSTSADAYLFPENTDKIIVTCHYTAGTGNRQTATGEYEVPLNTEVDCNFVADGSSVGIKKIKATKSGNKVFLSYQLNAAPSNYCVNTEVGFVSSTNSLIDGCSTIIDGSATRRYYPLIIRQDNRN